MILSARLLDTFDRCPRRFAFEQSYSLRTISPLGLLYAAIEGSLTALDPRQGMKDVIFNLTSRLEISSGDYLSPLSAVRHIEAMAEVISLALREKLGRATRLDPIPLDSLEWQPNLFSCRGKLHRLVLASHVDDDSLRSFAHSWGTIGELAAVERAFTLTLVVIGTSRAGRRHSPWAKGFLHPLQKSLRFGRRGSQKADGLNKGWNEVWREQTNISAEIWLDRLRVDEMLDEMILDRRIQYLPYDARLHQARKDMLALAGEMEKASPDSPMRRSSCDEIGREACPFQPVCYSAMSVTPADLPHLYQIHETLPEEQAV